jgi:FAD/FMN-containing dehydrogenase
MMAEQIIGLEVVLAGGAASGASPAAQGQRRLSPAGARRERALGVVTRTHLRPALPERAVALLGMDDAGAALDVIPADARRAPSLSALEVMFAECVELVCRHAGIAPPLGDAHAVVLLVECAGRTSPLDELLAALEAASDRVRETAVAGDEAGIRRAWRYRDAAAEAVAAAGVPHKLDVAVPLAAIPEFVVRVREHVARAEPGARLVIWGHVGDGNLHVNLLGLGPEWSG